MPAFLLSALKYLPGVGGLLDKFFGKSEEIARLEKQIELEHVRGLTKYGRITPRLLMRYIRVVTAGIAVVVLLLSIFCPAIVGFSWKDIVSGFAAIFSVMDW